MGEQSAKLSAVQRREAREALDRNGGDLSTTAIALLGGGWSQRQVAAALKRSKSWVRLQVEPIDKAPPRRGVVCRACAWRGSRPGSDPTVKPCPDCGGPVEITPHRRAEGAKRNRLNVYLDDATFAALQAEAGTPTTTATWVLTRWAAARGKR